VFLIALAALLYSRSSDRGTWAQGKFLPVLCYLSHAGVQWVLSHETYNTAEKSKNLSIYLSIYLSVYLSVYLLVCLSICLSK